MDGPVPALGAGLRALGARADGFACGSFRIAADTTLAHSPDLKLLTGSNSSPAVLPSMRMLSEVSRCGAGLVTVNGEVEWRHRMQWDPGGMATHRIVPEFEKWTLFLEPRLMNLARRKGVSFEDAQDAVAETLFRLWQKSNQRQQVSYAYRTLTNVLIDTGRFRCRHPETPVSQLPHPDAGAPTLPETPSDIGNPNPALMQERGELDAALQYLKAKNPDYFQAFFLQILEDIPAAEVASQLGIREDLVRQRVRRARLLLQNWLRNQGWNR